MRPRIWSDRAECQGCAGRSGSAWDRARFARSRPSRCGVRRSAACPRRWRVGPGGRAALGRRSVASDRVWRRQAAVGGVRPRSAASSPPGGPLDGQPASDDRIAHEPPQSAASGPPGEPLDRRIGRPAASGPPGEPTDQRNARSAPSGPPGEPTDKRAGLREAAWNRIRGDSCQSAPIGRPPAVEWSIAWTYERELGVGGVGSRSPRSIGSPDGPRELRRGDITLVSAPNRGQSRTIMSPPGSSPFASACNPTRIEIGNSSNSSGCSRRTSR